MSDSKLDQSRKEAPVLDDFPLKTHDKLRYRDTDRQGHVNNAVFSSLFETGRVELLYRPDNPLTDRNCSFVIARMAVDYFNEINWPGEVWIGTRVTRVGRSSLNLDQSLFQSDVCVARAETVIVQMDNSTRHSALLSSHAESQLKLMMVDVPSERDRGETT